MSNPFSYAGKRVVVTGAASYIHGHDLVADGGFNAAMATGQVDFSGLA